MATMVWIACVKFIHQSWQRPLQDDFTKLHHSAIAKVKSSVGLACGFVFDIRASHDGLI